MSERTQEGLAAVITKEISYNSDEDTHCPHCKKLVHKGYKWVEHTGALARKIVEYLVSQSLPERIQRTLRDDVEDALVCHVDSTGSPAKDGRIIAEFIWEWWKEE
ncbi:hypothetical protein LCGC14_3091600 [marine sediment metagenome]|uniref:Uncharacterized protein n=1 Tax=marine sediment metagenome TaxID=412755 RepID=A0A0F8Z0Q0_9ZZZZ